MKKLALLIIAASIGLLTFVLPVSLAIRLSDARSFLISPPTVPDGQSLAIDYATERSGGLNVNPQNREESLDFFSEYYVEESPTINWTGNLEECNPGTTSQQFRDSVLQQINYFRAMAGVPADISFKEEFNAKAQSAALIMAANRQLNHYPPINWKCYSDDGAEAAGNSNLGLGIYGAKVIAGYMADPGDFNFAVGHRRWILYPQTLNMGTGDVSANHEFVPANALWVLDEHIWDPSPPTREEFVAWPPPGFVPYQVVYPRWSFSYEDADFSDATVTMLLDGVAVPVIPEPVANGYGENSLVWISGGFDQGNSWPRPLSDTTYQVNVTNVRDGSIKKDFTYDVTVYDPYPLPKIVVFPLFIGSTLPPDDHSTSILTIGNIGESALDWQVSESKSSNCQALSDIPWLAAAPDVGTTAIGKAALLDVTFDSTGLAPGVYSGNLCISSDDPDPGPGNGTDLVVVPLELVVEKPDSVLFLPYISGPTVQ